jgi:hypothetical protein
MSVVSFPVTRPIGRALVVANPSSRTSLVELLTRLGFDCGECDDPYNAALELARRRLTYRALVLSLAGIFREELSLISTIKRRFPHLEIWLAHTDGRQATLAESMRLGADGLIDEEGPHRIVASQSADLAYHPLPQHAEPMSIPRDDVPLETASADMNELVGEPVLTAEELRALLQDQPAMPPSSTSEGQS